MMKIMVSCSHKTNDWQLISSLVGSVTQTSMSWVIALSIVYPLYSPRAKGVILSCLVLYDK